MKLTDKKVQKIFNDMCLSSEHDFTRVDDTTINFTRGSKPVACNMTLSLNTIIVQDGSYFVNGEQNLRIYDAKTCKFMYNEPAYFILEN